MKTPYVTPKALNPTRIQRPNHPWNRGYPNNVMLTRIVKLSKVKQTPADVGTRGRIPQE